MFTVLEMQSIYDLRRENMRALIKTWGGPTSLAKKLGHANASFLAQLAGPNPSRDISEKVAREIEHKLGLPPGALDSDVRQNAVVDDQLLEECVRAVAAAIRDRGLKATPDRYSNLVGLLYDHVRLTGRVDETYLNKLLKLTGD